MDTSGLVICLASCGPIGTNLATMSSDTFPELHLHFTPLYSDRKPKRLPNSNPETLETIVQSRLYTWVLPLEYPYFFHLLPSSVLWMPPSSSC